ncbi:hypothetical protein GCM10027589_17690 [Actinocorallia lasiicapitis]
MWALTVVGAIATVAAGTATNQVFSEGEWSWPWAALAVVFTLLVVWAAKAGAAGGRKSVYRRQLRASVTDMETIGIVTQGEYVLATEQVYVDVCLRPSTVRAAETGVARPAGDVAERRPLGSFLGEGKVLAVLGSPGSGKTTLARHAALRMCVRGRRRRLPVLLYLRDHADLILADPPADLSEVAVSASWLSGRISAGWLARRLERGRCVVLLDGLDEVADTRGRRQVVAWIRRQIARYPGNAFVLTSRPHGYYDNPLPNADVLEIQRFTGDQISRFLHSWYYAVECRARGRTGAQVRVVADRNAGDLLDRLHRLPALYDLAANPLLLTMIANVHRYRGALPGSRAALYNEMCDVLLHRRQEAKDLSDLTGLSGGKKEIVVRALAMEMMVKNVRDIAVGDALTIVREPLARVEAGEEVGAERFLEEVRRSGLLVERENGVYAFAHLTLQEYLASANIIEGRGSDLLIRTVDDSWWRETTLLWAAAADATPVVRACLARGTVAALTLAFDCADESRELLPDVRQQLEDLLGTPPELTDPDTARLLTGVAAGRALREVIWLDDGIAVCARPVPYDLYARYADTEPTTDSLVRPLGGDGASPVAGVLSRDAQRFTAWLRGLPGVHAYRLPTPKEADRLDIGLVPGLSSGRLWTEQPDGMRLHGPGGGTANLAAAPARYVEEIIRLAEAQLRLTLHAAHLRSRDAYTAFLEEICAMRSSDDRLLDEFWHKVIGEIVGDARMLSFVESARTRGDSPNAAVDRLRSRLSRLAALNARLERMPGERLEELIVAASEAGGRQGRIEAAREVDRLIERTLTPLTNGPDGWRNRPQRIRVLTSRTMRPWPDRDRADHSWSVVQALGADARTLSGSLGVTGSSGGLPESHLLDAALDFAFDLDPSPGDLFAFAHALDAWKWRGRSSMDETRDLASFRAFLAGQLGRAFAGPVPVPEAPLEALLLLAGTGVAQFAGVGADIRALIQYAAALASSASGPRYDDHVMALTGVALLAALANLRRTRGPQGLITELERVISGFVVLHERRAGRLPVDELLLMVRA